MGAYEFLTYGFGKTAQAAFSQCVKDAQYEHGHGGYTGTIAEKHSFVMVATPKTRLDLVDLAYCALGDADHITTYRDLKEGEDPKKSTRQQWDSGKQAMIYKVPVRKKLPPKLKAWSDKLQPIIDDKWGPAACVEVTGKAAKEYRDRRGLKGKRGKVFLFFGLASS